MIGGAGNDTLTGAGGRDIFDYGFKNAGNDTITDFTLMRKPVMSEVASIQQYVIKCVSDLRQIRGFLRVFRFLQPIKLTSSI